MSQLNISPAMRLMRASPLPLKRCLNPLFRTRRDYSVRVKESTSPIIRNASDILPPYSTSHEGRLPSFRVDKDAKPRIATIEDLLSADLQGEHLVVEVDGWVQNVTKVGDMRFVFIGDGSCTPHMQAVMSKELFKQHNHIGFGTAVRLHGVWRPSKDGKEAQTRSVELEVHQIEILGPSQSESLPIQKKYTTPEHLRTIPHFRMRKPLNAAMLRFRSEAQASLSRFFSAEKFQQVHPPIITASDCEGAGETFRVEAGSMEDPFSKKQQHLTVSSQLHLEAFAQALGNVWTLSPTFRAERSDTSRHLSEFYMLEAEMSFVDDMEEVLNFIQKMLCSLAIDLAQGGAWGDFQYMRAQKKPDWLKTMADLDSEDTLKARWEGLMSPKMWPRITYTEAIEELQAHSDKFEHVPQWGKSLQSEHERFLAERIGSDKDGHHPVFVTHYPREIKAFYMRQSADNPSQGLVFDCFDLIVPDLGELAGGSMREHRHNAMLANMKELIGEKPQSLDWYLDLSRWGCPPHGGFGIGFDRLLSYLTGVKSVRDIAAFPRHYGYLKC